MSPTKAPASATVEIVNVTPAMARKWLEANDVNRNLRTKLVAAYRRDMEAGRWEFTGEPIQISRTGRLLNGQHRLTALANTKNVRHLMLVVATGLEDHAQTMMDQGKSRTIRDALTLEHGHIKNVTMAAAVSRMVAIVDMPGPHMTPSLMRSKVTAAEALAAYNKFPEIELACQQAKHMNMTRTLFGSPSASAYCWLSFHRVDPSENVEFWAGIADENWSWKNDPRKAAARRMRTVHYDQEVKTSIETSVMLVSVMTRAWNAWRNKEEVESIMVKSKAGVILPVKPV